MVYSKEMCTKKRIAMKNPLIAFLLLFSLESFSQESIARGEIPLDDVPLEVIDAFHRMHLDGSVDVWRVSEDLYQAEYRENGKTYFDLFNSKGGYIETKFPFPWKEAPKVLKNGLNKTYYKYWEVLESYKVTDETDNLFYTLRVKNKEDGTERTVYFDEEGTLEAKSKSDYTN